MTTFNSLLPPNASQLERDLEIVMARIESVPIDFQKIWRAYECPAELLPWLAWAFNVDLWRSDWPEATKREIIATAIEWHRHKGTPWSIMHMLKFAGAPDTQIMEWWQGHPTGPYDPHTFCLVAWSNPSLNPRMFDQAFLKHIKAFIDISKPVRSHFCLRTGVKAEAETLKLSNVAKTTGLCRVTVDKPNNQFEYQHALNLGSLAQTVGMLRVTHRPQPVEPKAQAGLGFYDASHLVPLLRQSLSIKPAAKTHQNTIQISANSKHTGIQQHSVEASPKKPSYTKRLGMTNAAVIRQLARIPARLAQTVQYKNNLKISAAIKIRMIYA